MEGSIVRFDLIRRSSNNPLRRRTKRSNVDGFFAKNMGRGMVEFSTISGLTTILLDSFDGWEGSFQTGLLGKGLATDLDGIVRSTRIVGG